MYLHKELYDLLIRYLPLNKARLDLMSLLIEAVLKLQTVNLTKLALILNPSVRLLRTTDDCSVLLPTSIWT